MADVTGLLASAVVSAVGTKLGSAIGDQVTMLCCFKDDMEDMKEKLESMAAVLKDAERRSVKDESVRLWLKRLKNAAHDISDMLDEFQPNAKSASGMMMGKLLSITSKITMANKMKKMRDRLRKIKVDHESFGFTHDTSLNNVHQFPDPRETTSKVIQSLIIGRDEERKKVLSLLSRSNSEEDTTVLAIHGIGGIGKTTLAQLVFNDAQFKDYDHRVWVYVSQVFDLKKIGNSIISQVLKQENYQNADTRELINQRLQDLLKDKKTLIVLDDVWETNNSQLNELKLMLNVSYKMKVLVTTRDEDIARKISTGNNLYRLVPLNNDMCWSIIKKCSELESRADKEQFEQVGQKIAEKCGGVPLAAQALGFLLSGKDLTEWNAVSNSDIWDESCSDMPVLPSLKLSYKTMAPHLRLCFAYCAIFPKGHNIRKDYLIHQWIALDFIEASNTFSAIQLGEKYVRQLRGMSFLQHSQLPKVFQKQPVYTMHDLVYDVARSVIDEELLVLDDKKGSSTRRQTYCRYALLANYSGPTKISAILTAKLRALHFLDCSKLELNGGAFSFAKCLRVLDLTEVSFREFPSSIGQLKQMRFLIAPKLQDRRFPKSIIQLPNLRYLDLSHCSKLASLPESLRNLQNLHTLYFSYCRELTSLPESLGNLQNLRTLDLSWCSQLTSLPESLGNLQNLHTLDLLGCLKLTSLPESLGNLQNIPTLDLSGCLKLTSLPESLGNLQNLYTLDLSGCLKLTSLPESLGNLQNLHTLDLSWCWELTSLPESLGNLQNLHTLDLSGCWELTSLPESLGNLQNLHTLDLSGCWELTSLPESLGNLQNLHTLDLSGCSQLTSLPESLGNLQNLHTLDLSGCSQLTSLPESLGNLQNLHTLDLSGCSELTSLPESLGNLQNLHTLDLSRCWNLTSLPESLGNLRNLHTLGLSRCSKLTSLPESLGNLQNLHTLDLFECSKLTSLPESLGNLQNLHTLDLSGCSQLTSLPESLGNLQNLHTLDLSGCSELTSLPESLGNLQNLHTLDLSRCWNLTSLPESLGNLRNLHTLGLSRCSKLTSLPESLGNIQNLHALDPKVYKLN